MYLGSAIVPSPRANPTTLAPSFRKCSAIMRPTPRRAPLTTAILSAYRFIRLLERIAQPPAGPSSDLSGVLWRDRGIRHGVTPDAQPLQPVAVEAAGDEPQL